MMSRPNIASGPGNLATMIAIARTSPSPSVTVRKRVTRFDVELTRVPPGQKPCPVHEHSHWTEFFIVVSGTGEVTRNDEKARVGSGDCFIQPAGTRHRIANASETEDLVYYVIANEHPNDSVIRHEV